MCFIILQVCQKVQSKCQFLACAHSVSRVHGHSVYFTYSRNLQVQFLSYAISYKRSYNSFVSRSVFAKNPISTASRYGWGGFYTSNHRSHRLARSQIHAAVDVATAVEVINDLGLDTLTLLMVTVLVVPAFKILKASPVRIRSITFSLQLSFIIFWFLFFTCILCLVKEYKCGHRYFNTLANDI